MDKPIALDPGLLVLYAIAGIAGAIGGCGAGAVIVLSNKRQVRGAQFVAYVLIGLMTGLLFLGFGHLAGIDTHNPEILIRWTLGLGIAVPVILFSHNWALSAILKRFGWEIQVTVRRGEEDRRGGEARGDRREA